MAKTPVRTNWKDPEKFALLGSKPDAELAKDLGCTKEAIWRARRRYGVEAHPPKRWPEVDWSSVDFAGLTDTDIAEQLGVVRTTVTRYRKRKGLGLAQVITLAESQTLLEDLVALSSFRTAAAIAEALGVPVAEVRAWKQGRRPIPRALATRMRRARGLLLRARTALRGPRRDSAPAGRRR